MLLVRNPKRKQDYEDQEDFYIYDFKKRGHYEACDKLKTLNLQPISIKPAKKLVDQVYLKPTSDDPKLFNMCLRFIALNVECVDSFHTLPSLIGREIFMECVKVNKFDSEKYEPDLILECISLFSKAYPELLIESINLCNLPKDLLLFMTNILARCSVKKLNLSQNQLNEPCDQKSVEQYSSLESSSKIDLTNILKNSQQTLEHLNLSENSLDENFIQKLTLSQRLKSQNFRNLRFIDLSRNYKIRSLDFLKYFTKYEGLEEVLVSVLKGETVFVKHGNQTNNFYGFMICVCSTGYQTVGKTGWFEAVCIEKLKPVEKQRQLSSLKEYSIIKNRDENVKTSIKFYENKAKIEEVCKSANEKAKNLANLFRVISLKKQCNCFISESAKRVNNCKEQETESKQPTQSKFAKNFKKKNDENALNKIKIDSDILKMYS